MTPPGKKVTFKEFSVISPAKINLFLKITGIRKDGYHKIASVFQMVDLHDKITFSPEPGGNVRVVCSDRAIPEKENLAWKAAMSLHKPGAAGVRIGIEKNIPSGAGLGGGSSNAATVLYVLNLLWGLKLSGRELNRIAARLGADVPFFLFSTRAWVTGIGERLKPLPEAEKFYALLAQPGVKVSTQKAYKDFDARLTKTLKTVKIPAQLRKVGVSLGETASLLKNDLEETVLDAYPAIAALKRELKKLGKGVMLTGSGSALFVLFKNRKRALSAERTIAKRFSGWRKIVAPVNSMAHLTDISGRIKWK